MKIKFSYPIWGSEYLPLETFFRKIKSAGYCAVEMGIPFDKEYINKLKLLLQEYDLSLIAQQCIHTPNLSAPEYTIKMEKYLRHLASIQPKFINSHTGRDYYSFEENCKLFELCEKIESQSGVKIVHETHRGRALYSTGNTKQFFNKYTSLKITADFSHWCCVSESLLNEQQDFLETAMQRAEYIHARVGNQQSPQINHPAAPEHKEAVDAHMLWWAKILSLAKEKGNKEFWVCTEFGPSPYMQTLPFTNQVVAEQLEVNLHIKKLITDTCTNL